MQSRVIQIVRGVEGIEIQLMVEVVVVRLEVWWVSNGGQHLRGVVDAFSLAVFRVETTGKPDQPTRRWEEG